MLQVKTIVSRSSWGSLDVRLSSTESHSEVVEHKEKVVSEEGDILFYNKYSDNTYSFGLVQGARVSFGHTKGYVWSSRASVVNKYFGTRLIEVGICYAGNAIAISRAIDVDALRDILPEDFHIVEGQYNDGEEFYDVELKVPRKVECGEVLYKIGDGDTDTPIYNITTITLNDINNN